MYFSFSIRVWPKVSLVLCHHCNISNATQSVLPRHQTLARDQTAPLQLHTVWTFKTRSLLFSFQCKCLEFLLQLSVLSGIYTNISLFHSYSEVTVATQIQSVSRSDGGSAPRDNLNSPEFQQRPHQIDELQRQILSEDLFGHRDKTTRTRHVLCSI